MNKSLLGVASLLTVGVLFGLSGVIAKYLSGWLNPYQVVEYRFAIAFFIATFVLLVTKQKLSFSKIDPKALVFFALTFPVSVIFFTLAIFNTTVSLAVFSFYISTLVSSFVVGKIFFGEQITKNKKIALFFILLAVIAFTDPFKNFNLQIGFVYGIISGIFQTIASSYQKTLGKSTNRISLLFIQTLTGIIVASSALIYTSNPILVALPTTALLISFVFGAIFLAISYLFLVGFKYTNLNTGSILVSSELFFGPFFAYTLLSEKLGVTELIGGLLIAISIIFANRD